jgi:hypothetical protein
MSLDEKKGMNVRLPNADLFIYEINKIMKQSME